MIRAYFSLGLSWRQTVVAIILTLLVTSTMYTCSKAHAYFPFGKDGMRQSFVIIEETAETQQAFLIFDDQDNMILFCPPDKKEATFPKSDLPQQWGEKERSKLKGKIVQFFWATVMVVSKKEKEKFYFLFSNDPEVSSLLEMIKMIQLH